MEAAAQEQTAANLASGAVAGQLGTFDKACRVKTWDECTPEQRMDMLRQEARYLRRTVEDLQRTLRKLQAHQHGQDGKIMVPLNDRNDEDRPRGYFYDPLK